MLLVPSDDRMVKLSPMQLRQRRDAARSRDHAPFAAGHSPGEKWGRRAKIAGAVGLVAAALPVYRQAGRIQSQHVNRTWVDSKDLDPHFMPHPSATADDVAGRVAGMKRKRR